ncbi:hypothetical protein [Bacillus licheniformis]|uniref:hypothetical protein n=1 Tax=Bacillus licheniformis TaxID=1402 RepID=UPI001C21120D|nr:hypothetical protein [Bacillus licheniformis]MBU8739743.1 hypothetical protein [Bacillus licheniformis]
MKNQYEIRGDTTAIFIESKKYGSLETLISTNDLEKAKEIEGWWHASWDNCIKNFYVKGNKRNTDGSWRKVRLHRWIMGVDDSKVQVDHILQDTLDNCRWALRVVTAAQNSQNRGVPSNNTSGQRGVYWNGRLNKWEARIDVNKKTKYLGYFRNKKDAINARKSAEEVYWI